MIPVVNPTTTPRLQKEFTGVLLIVLAFVLVNLLVATRTPTVYCDEPGYTDPSANLYFGAGFTSTMWGQDHHAFWCGNTPLYQGILYGWFKAFGFGLFQVRALNTFLTGLAAWFIWAGLRKANLIEQPAHRMTALALILSGSVSTLTFRTGRYDSTMFLICAAVFFCYCLPVRWRGRLILIFLCSALLPAAGIPMLPYATLMALINIATYGFSNLSVLTSVAAGLLAGIAALFAFYRHFSDWHTFLEIVLPFTGIGVASQSKTSGLAAKIFGQNPGDDTLFSCWFGIPTEFLSQKTLFDYSAALLFLLVVIISIIMWRSADKKDRQLIVFVVSVTLIIPPVMHFAGHYRSYYRWMTYIPLAIALPRLLEAQCQTSGQNKFRRFFFVVIGISVFLGVPLRTLVILPHWAERSPQPLEKVAANIVQPSDLVVCNFKAYFAIRSHAKLVYAYGMPARGDFSREYDLATNQVTLLCLFSNDLYTVTNVIGGRWKKVPLNHIPEAAALSKTRYAMEFYQRDSN